jgi:ParB/Sulfiredoxin domain
MAVAVLAPRLPRWHAWPALEAKLAKLGIVWEYREDVQINLIDLDAGKQNQARPGEEIDEERVEQFRLAMVDGQPFPAVVCYEHGDGTYYPADGNHRIPAAMGAGYTTIDMYVLKAPEDSVRHLITTSVNLLNGVRPTLAQTIAQAINTIELTGRSATWVAQWYDLPHQTLTRALQRRSALNRLRGVGLSEVKVGQGALEALATIPTDAALREATDVVVRARLTERQARDLSRDIRQQHSEAGQLAVVSQVREAPEIQRRIAEAGRGAQRIPPDPIVKRRGQLFGALRNAEQLLKRFPSRLQMGLVLDDQRKEAAELALKVAQMIEGLDGA